MDSKRTWQEAIAQYQKPDNLRSIWQLINTLVPYAALWVFMAFSLKISYWLTLVGVILAGGLLVRIFIIFHDCGHGSFFKSAKANAFWGFITGILIFTPYSYWWHKHAQHHASSGDLDRRGIGDVWTMTVKEYLAASRWLRIKYRLARNPLVLFVIAPPFLFLVLHRIPHKISGPRAERSVHLTNLAVLGMVAVLVAILGVKNYLLIQLPIVWIAASAGVWLFYVQHQFEGVYWERHENWDYLTEAIQGSSFYKLPKILQWFTGNIGFHHVHHLSPKIPNYFLERCHREVTLFCDIKPITLLASFKSLVFRLWDEKGKRLVGFGDLKRIKATA